MPDDRRRQRLSAARRVRRAHARLLTAAGSTLTASMLRDIENGNQIEADHIVGDLIRRGERAGISPEKAALLRLAYAHLKAYEARLRRPRSSE
jgi:2-dehydropantoate 2-reductase